MYTLFNKGRAAQGECFVEVYTRRHHHFVLQHPLPPPPPPPPPPSPERGVSANKAACSSVSAQGPEVCQPPISTASISSAVQATLANRLGSSLLSKYSPGAGFGVKAVEADREASGPCRLATASR